MAYYTTFQLNISSELIFPELLPGYPQATVDCHIHIGQVNPKGLTAPSQKGVTYQVAPQQFWLSLPNIGRFFVENGCSITVEPGDSIDEATLRLFILGPCLAALLLQQGKYVLKGDVVTINNHACALIGGTGVGKSVLAHALTQQHHKLISSGLCVIDASRQVLPGYPHLHLWSDAIQLLALEKPTERIRPTLEKWSIPVSRHFSHEPVTLHAIYALETHNQAETCVTRLHGMSKFNPLRAHAYHQPLIRHFIDLRQHQLQGTRLASKIHMTKITRPDKGNTVESLITLITNDLNTHGAEHA